MTGRISGPPVTSRTTAAQAATAAIVRPAARATRRRRTPYQAAEPAISTHARIQSPRGNSSIASTMPTTTAVAAASSETAAATCRLLIGSTCVGPRRGREALGPRRLHGGSAHAHTRARRRHEPALAGGRLLAALAGLGRSARARRWAARAPGGGAGTWVAGGHRRDRQPRREAALAAPPAGPRRPGRATWTPCADAALPVVPVRALRRRVRLRHRGRPGDAASGDPVAWTCRARRLLSRPHRRSLPRRRPRRRADGNRAGAAHDERARAPRTTVTFCFCR